MDVLKVIFIGVAVFVINIPLSLLILVCFPISYAILNIFGKILRTKNKEILKTNDSYFSDIQQSISGIREIRSLGLTDNRFTSFLILACRLKDKAINFVKISSVAQLLSNSITFLSQIAIMTLGGYFIFINTLSFGNFIAFSAYSNQFSNSLMNITNLNCNIQQSLASLERIFNLMDNLSYIKPKYGNINIKNVKGMITFENVCFKYNNDKVALDNINFEIQPNKKIALIGPSGGGKTTIFNLLLRFYEPTSENIKIDDIKITDIDEQMLRNNISIVRQDLYLFDMSISDNLLLVNPKATIYEVQEACKLAYIHDFIMTLPQNYDSIIGENGINISSGQKQRLAIARALLKKSKILLLDEITSALDSQSQMYIRNSIDEISKNHTVIMIAHRLSTISIADEIYIVDGGKICEKGTHSTLIKKSKLYKNFFENESCSI